MQLAWKVEEGSKVKLKDYDPNYVDKYTDRALASAELEKLSEELSQLQQLLAAAQHHSLLVVRVHNLVPEKIWRRRYSAINNFEQMLAENDMIILKFYLHISNQEQEARLLARQEEKTKAWKLSAADWAERQYWNDYQAAYEDALSKCSTDEAPWYIVPANRKWYRNLLVARTIVQTLRPYKKEWMDKLVKRGERERTLIEEFQKTAG